MCMYFKTETDTLQNLIDDFLTLIVREDQRSASFFEVLSWKYILLQPYVG